MYHLARDEAIDWCIKNKANFDEPSPFPPPTGWVWADSDHTHCLTIAMLHDDEDDDGDIESICVLLAAAAKKGVKYNKWIKCSERMPEDNGDLILIWNINDWELAFYDKGTHAYDSPNSGWIEEHLISHWTQLPDPPE